MHGRKNESRRDVQARAAALAIRLRPNASFQQKLRQLIIKMLTEKAPTGGRFPDQDGLRWQQI